MAQVGSPEAARLRAEIAFKLAQHDSQSFDLDIERITERGMDVAMACDFVAVIRKYPKRVMKFFEAGRGDRNRHVDAVCVQHVDERCEALTEVLARVDITG